MNDFHQYCCINKALKTLDGINRVQEMTVVAIITDNIKVYT